MLGTDIYIDLKTHREVMQVPNIKIFHYCGSINFASRAGFKKDLFNAIGVDHRVIRRASLCESAAEARGFGQGMRTLILDLSAVAHLDNSGWKTFTEIKNEMKLLGVKFNLASASDCVYDSLVHATTLGEPSFECFSTVHDAVLFSQGKSTMSSMETEQIIDNIALEDDQEKPLSMTIIGWDTQTIIEICRIF